MASNTSEPRLWDDVRAVLETHEFPVLLGAYLEGDLASVEAVPRRRPGEDHCDLEVTITPYGIAGEVDPAVEAGARKEYEKANASRRKAIREAAAYELERLDSRRWSAPPLGGQLLLLKRKLGDSWTILLPGARTDEGGRAVFTDVAGDSICSLRLHSARAQRTGAGSPGEVKWSSTGTFAPAPAEPGSPRELRSLRYMLQDRRISAVLEEARDGSAALSIQSGDRTLAGAAVRFQMGDRHGEILLAADPTGMVSGTAKLNQPYAHVEFEVPSFDLVMPSSE
jgi:hypothetical protein